MLHRVFSSLVGIALVFAMFSSAHGTNYSEAVNGDLSGNGLSPTVIPPLTVGSNLITGTTGGTDRDYFTVHVPFTSTLVLLIEGAGTQAGNLGFLGVQKGTQVTLPTTTTTAAGLLGWIHYSATNVDLNILPAMGNPNPTRGEDGFVPPLPPGDYSFWLQDTSSGGPFNFSFNLVVSPEPPASALMITGIIGLWLFTRGRKIYQNRL